jgi:hypothetical protein
MKFLGDLAILLYSLLIASPAERQQEYKRQQIEQGRKEVPIRQAG